MHQLLQPDPDIQYTLPIVHRPPLCNTIHTHMVHTVLLHSLTKYTLAMTQKQEDALTRTADQTYIS